MSTFSLSPLATTLLNLDEIIQCPDCFISLEEWRQDIRPRLSSILQQAPFRKLTSSSLSDIFHALPISPHPNKADKEIKVKSLIVAAWALATKYGNPSILSCLQWESVDCMMAHYGCHGDFVGCSNVEWNNLLAFRNALVLIIHVFHGLNKNIMEMSAGFLCSFFRVMSGSKPSMQVKRRHIIYHQETNTKPIPRARTKRVKRSLAHDDKIIDEHAFIASDSSLVSKPNDLIDIALLNEILDNHGNETDFTEEEEEEDSIMQQRKRRCIQPNPASLLVELDFSQCQPAALTSKTLSRTDSFRIPRLLTRERSVTDCCLSDSCCPYHENYKSEFTQSLNYGTLTFFSSIDSSIFEA
eukprot:scaffold4837_cov163-Ochromonas_danica.AAC.6